MVAKKRTGKSADTVILDVLVYEDDREEAERKIKRRLRYHGLAPYQQERVELLHRLKNEIESEAQHAGQSRYFAGSHGKYRALEDFDTDRLIRDLAASYPDVPQEEIKRFVPFAIYLCYLR